MDQLSEFHFELGIKYADTVHYISTEDSLPRSTVTPGAGPYSI